MQSLGRCGPRGVERWSRGQDGVKFAYYKRLGTRQRRIYDRSDSAGAVRVPGARDVAPLVAAVSRGLEADDRRATETSVQQLVDTLCKRLHVQPVTVRVLAVRPSNHREELHGLYEFGGGRQQPVVSVWMRTAQRRQVVAFRTFMRTFLHEVVHHLDYQLLRLEDSYHTQGFYKRAESLYRQLVPAELVERAPVRAAPAVAAPPAEPQRRRRVIPEPAGTEHAPAPPRPTKRRTPAPQPQPLLPFML